MMELNNLPSFIRCSHILTDIEKSKLATATVIPSEIEVDTVRHFPEIQEMTNAFIGDESTRTIYLQLKAQEYLAKDEVMMAWKVLLL